MPKPTRVLMMILMSIVAIGCVAGKVPRVTDAGSGQIEAWRTEDQPESLFKGDSAVLSDAEIVRILGWEVKLGGHHRVAVLRLGRTRFSWEDDAQADIESMSVLLDQLRSDESVSEAQLLPSLLIPEKKTVPYLREAGARFQADLLLIYNSSVRTFEKTRMLGKDEVRARCTVEAIVLHVPTGIVPFSASATEEIHALRKADDLDFSETVAKSVSAAQRTALTRIAEETVAFLRKHRGP